GYSGQFGHILNAPYIWLPLCAIFFLGLFDLRRVRRIAHLDLLVLLSFGVSQIFYNDAEIGAGAVLAYPPLIYLLARMIWIGFKGRGSGLRPSAPIAWLVVATVFLCGFRIAVNVADSGVIDVGYAGVVGADRITHGEPIYGEEAFPPENRTGDTYGPVNYAAYVPFEQAFPWSGSWDDLPAAHAATIFFDLAAIVGLVALGRRLRPGRAGRDLGVVLAFAWTAYPYTDFVMQSNSNDSLVAALLIWGLVAFSSLGWRALLVALAAGAKFTPLFLLPLFATGYEGLARFSHPSDKPGVAGRLRSLRLPRPVRLRLLYFGTVFASAVALLLVYPAIDPGLATAWDRTILSQLDRTSPFSIWGQVPALGPLKALVLIVTAGFAASLALVPRQRSLIQVVALSAAVMIAVQLTLEHWFYPYIVWFFGMLMAAIALQAPSDSAAVPERRQAEPERVLSPLPFDPVADDEPVPGTPEGRPPPGPFPG
ncbi:MAG: glycosyltransferase 87 family protein, partial [Brevundimonas sp.]